MRAYVFAIDLSFLVEYGEYVLAFFVPRDFWDHLCPRAWDHLCPAFMELRVNLRCQIVCVYLTCFLNLGLRDNLCPLPDSGLSVPSI